MVSFVQNRLSCGARLNHRDSCDNPPHATRIARQRWWRGGIGRFGAMSEDKSEFYQGKADELRNAAGQVRFEDTRGQLLGLARLFDRLADRIRGREQAREAAD